MATKKKKKVVKKPSKPLSRDQQIANIKKQAQGIQSSLNKSVASGTIKSGSSSSSKPATTTKPTTKPATTTSVSSGNPVDTNLYLKPGETPDQYNARTRAYFDSKKTPVPQTTDALTNFSVGLANGSITNQEQTNQVMAGQTQQQTPEDWAKAFTDAMSQNNPDTSGVGTQSTQGDATAGEQPGVNDVVAGAMGGQAPGGGSVGGSVSGGSGLLPGQVTPGGTLMDGGTPMATVATGGYQKIGPAYFQKSSDGMRAVSDPSIISGLKHGTIPYTTGQLDGTTFSKNSVPLAQSQNAIGIGTDEGAGLSNTYDNYKNKYGLSQTQTDYFNDPMKTIKDITSQIFATSGVSDANDMIRGITDDLEDLENKRDDEIADINDNPWLTEGVRLRQIASVEGRYEDKIANRTNKLRLLEDVRNNAQQQAQFAIGTAISLWDKERTFQQHQIDMWNENAQREIDNTFKARQLDIAEASMGTATMQEYIFAKENGFDGDIIDYQATVASRTRAPSSDGGLTMAGMNSTINQITGAFDNEPIVKEYNTITAGLNFIRSLGTSPTDDQARIYQFAKIMDPNSAVREGEYATVQEYSTALLQRYGLNAQRVFTNSGILTPEARTFLSNTLEKRYVVSQGQYTNLQSSYQNRINNVMGGGFNTLPDYTYSQPQGQTNILSGFQQQQGLKSVDPSQQESWSTLPGGMQYRVSY